MQALADAVRYKRAGSYFSSSVFGVAPEAFEGFFRRHGEMQLICCPKLTGEDVRALSAVCFHQKKGQQDGEHRGISILRQAYGDRQLHIRVALRRNDGALYHEKFGVFESSSSNRVGHIGSANETGSGYLRNFELIQTLASDQGAEQAIALRQLAAAFDEFWIQGGDGFEVLELREAFQARLIEAYDVTPDAAISLPKALSMPSLPKETLRLPDDVTLREHQLRAMRSWLGAEKGILAMATGAGKTITALASAERLLIRDGPPLVLVVVAPYRHLVQQWKREANRFGLRPIVCSSDNPDWRQHLSSAIFAANQKATPVASAVVTNATFLSAAFQTLLGTAKTKAMLVVDEVHNFGAARLADALPQSWSCRMGLSATPSRHFDEVGSKRIQDYFGGVVARFDIKDALEARPPVLTPYRYEPVLVQLEEDEIEQYLQVTDKIAKTIRDASDDELGEVAVALLMKRSRIVATAKQKLGTLRNLLTRFKSDSQILVYCGDGSSEMDLEDSEVAKEGPVTLRQVEQVASVLGVELGMRVATYTAKTSMKEREELRTEFASGGIQALIAIRCLDEGVDFPEARRAFILASSTNPRQFIQRRGRILRTAPNKNFAEIFDFVVEPPTSATHDPRLIEVMKRLFRREMERVIEFADTATNGASVRASLGPLLKRLDMMDLA